MRTILDAYALIAFLVDEPAAPQVEDLLRRQPAAITSINYAEVLDRLVRAHGVPEHAVAAAMAPLLDDGLDEIDVDFRLARSAARLRSGHYHRIRCPLSLADCVCLAAVAEGDVLATADAPMLEVADAEGIETIRLPPAGGGAAR
jgi:PIN domain nuclease of toxin-antitoxin system